MIFEAIRIIYRDARLAGLEGLVALRRPGEQVLQVKLLDVRPGEFAGSLVVGVIIPGALDPGSILQVEGWDLGVAVHFHNLVGQAVDSARLMAEDPIKIIESSHPGEAVRPQGSIQEVVDGVDLGIDNGMTVGHLAHDRNTFRTLLLHGLPDQFF